jgi:hypothetical protein
MIAVGFTKSGHTDIHTDRQMRSKPEVAPQHPRVVIQLKTKTVLLVCDAAQAVFNEFCSMFDPGKPAFVPKKGKPNVIMFVGLQGKSYSLSPFSKTQNLLLSVLTLSGLVPLISSSRMLPRQRFLSMAGTNSKLFELKSEH